MNEIVDMINQYGVPVVVAVGMAYFIFYIWKFVTSNILPSLGQASTTLVALIDRVRMLDNDMIRLDQKINTIIEIQDQQNDPHIPVEFTEWLIRPREKHAKHMQPNYNHHGVRTPTMQFSQDTQRSNVAQGKNIRIRPLQGWPVIEHQQHTGNRLD